jgi:ABC-2 type transport system ATP-binding protein
VIRERFGRKRVVHFTLHEPLVADARLESALTELAITNRSQPEAHQLLIEFDSMRSTAGAVIGRLLPLLPIHDVRVEEPSIEGIIRELYEGKLQFKEAVA